MGTRADFYVGLGCDAEWIGSVAWDGHEWAEDETTDIVSAKTEEHYRSAVKEMFSGRDDVSEVKDGWPWPWDDSKTTDYAYAFTGGGVKSFEFGVGQEEWPDMSAVKNVQFGGKKSGLIVMGS